MAVINIPYFGRDPLSTVVVVLFFALAVLLAGTLFIELVIKQRSIRPMVKSYVKTFMRPIALFILQCIVFSVFVLTQYICVDSDINRRFKESMESTEAEMSDTFMSRNAVILPAAIKDSFIFIVDTSNEIKSITNDIEGSNNIDEAWLSEYRDQTMSRLDEQMADMKLCCYLLVALVLLTVFKRAYCVLGKTKHLRKVRRA